MLSPSLADFICGDVSISLAGRDMGGAPTLVRGYGCRVSYQPDQVHVLVSRTQAQALLRGVEHNGVLAMSCSVPISHQTIQLKGVDATAHPPRIEDKQLLESYNQRFTLVLQTLGYPDPFTDAFRLPWNDDIVRIQFTPQDVFIQTPGARAGERMTT